MNDLIKFKYQLSELVLTVLLFVTVGISHAYCSVNFQQKDTLDYWNVQKFVINQKTTDAQFSDIKKFLNKENVEIEFSDISRNQVNQLQSLSITYHSVNSTGNFSISKDEPFKLIKIEYDVTGKKLRISQNSETNLSHTIQLEPKRVKIPLNTDTTSTTTHPTKIKIGESHTDVKVKNEPVKIIITQNNNVSVADSLIVEENKLQQWVSKDGSKIKIYGEENQDNLSVSKLSENPLFIVNDDIYKGDINAINPNDIDSISVLKGDSAKKLYGEKGSNGVVLIYTTTYRETNATKKEHIISNDSEHFLGENIENTVVYADSKSTDIELQKNKDALALKNIKTEYNVKRDKEGIITKLKITLINSDGDKTVGSYANDYGIDRLRYGLKDDEIFVKSFREE